MQLRSLFFPIDGGRADYSELHARRPQHRCAAVPLRPIACERDQHDSLSNQAC